MILLKTWDYAEVRLTLWTMIFGFSSEDPATAIGRIPAKVAGKSRTITCLRTMAKLLHSWILLFICFTGTELTELALIVVAATVQNI